MPWYKYNIDLTKNPPYDSPHLNTAQLSGPILPLSFANVLWILYVTHDPGQCNLGFLDFCLIAGCVSLFTVIISLACKIMVEDAWADGMLSRKESIVVWLMVNSHHVMLLSQVIIFFVFFIYIAVSYKDITYTDMNSDYYCTREITLTSLVISTIFCASCLFATLLIICFWGFTRIGGKDDGIQMEDGNVSRGLSPATRSSSGGFHASPERPRSIISTDTSSTDSDRPVP